MAITFGGLATGMDTESIISAMMAIERAPIDRLETDKSYFTNRLKAFSSLETKLETLMSKVKAIDSDLKLNSPTIDTSSDTYFTASASGNAQLGSYQIKVMDLAQQQKDVSLGYADKESATFGTGSISLTVNGEAHSIDIDSESNSLDGLAQAINDADLGVSATIINDGTASPYRLVLTGDDVSQSFSLDTSGLSGGTDANPTMSTTQIAQQAHIQLDGIDIYANSNTVDSSIPGLSLELLTADETMSTSMNVSKDESATSSKIKDVVTAYNDIVKFIADQKSADWGNDSAFRSVKSRLQGMLVSQQSGTGTYSALSQIGFETRRDGTISLDSGALTKALEGDYDSVLSLFSGTSESDGLAAQFADYLDGITDSVDGIYASRKKSTDSNVRRIEQKMTNLESRMDLKEQTLRSQFTAMEDLVSGLNSQGNYLLQQLANMPAFGG